MKIIILDYTRGKVAIISAPPASAEKCGDVFQKAVEAWCKAEQISPDECHWMAWNGEIKIA